MFFQSLLSRKKATGPLIVHFFFELRDQLKLYHWQTDSFARHKATDETIQELDEHIDMFMETWMGRYGRPHLNTEASHLRVSNLSKRAADTMLQDAIRVLIGPLTAALAITDTDLANIRDEMIATLHKLAYLFTLA